MNTAALSLNPEISTRPSLEFIQASTRARSLAKYTNATLTDLPRGGKNEVKSEILKSRAAWSESLASWAGTMGAVCLTRDPAELHRLLDTAATTRAELIEGDSVALSLAEGDYNTFHRALYPSYHKSRCEAFRRVGNLQGAELDDNPAGDDIVVQFWDIGRGSE
jgi:hypothetical protein